MAEGIAITENKKNSNPELYCIVLYLQPVLNPKSYDGARVLEASGRPMLVIGRSYLFDSIQEDEITGGEITAEESDGTAKQAEETTVRTPKHHVYHAFKANSRQI